MSGSDPLWSCGRRQFGAHPLRVWLPDRSRPARSVSLLPRSVAAALTPRPWAPPPARSCSPHSPAPRPAAVTASPAAPAPARRKPLPSAFHVGHAVTHQIVNDPRQFVRRRRDRLRRPQTRTLPPQVGPQVTLAAHQAPRRQTQGAGRAVLAPPRSARLALCRRSSSSWDTDPSQLVNCLTVGHLLKSLPSSLTKRQGVQSRRCPRWPSGRRPVT